jgi:hypothetical protein
LVEKECESDFALFRGQREDLPLVPRIARVRRRENILKTEQDMLAAFKREALTFLDRIPDSDWDWLSIAQHHGLPTRLLDWTKNPLAALWFTVELPARSKNKPAVVWMFRPAARDIIDKVTAESPFEGSRTKVFVPRHVTPRIRAQVAIFTIHKYVPRLNKFVPLERMARQRDLLRKFIVPPESFSDIRYELDRCGVNASSLFPDLDGLAHYTEWFYSLLEDEKQ